MGRLILNIGSGKIPIEDIDKYTKNGDLIVLLDRSYCVGATDSQLEQLIIDWKNKNREAGGCISVSSDIFEFLDTFKIQFEHIIASRIFEHMSYCQGEIGRLLEACNMSSTEHATMDIIVPNAIQLATQLMEYENGESYCKNNDCNSKLIINTEFCNIRQDPHLSVWTPELAKEYILCEGTWKIHSIKNLESYKNRSIYMQILCYKGQGFHWFQTKEEQENEKVIDRI